MGFVFVSCINLMNLTVFAPHHRSDISFCLWSLQWSRSFSGCSSHMFCFFLLSLFPLHFALHFAFYHLTNFSTTAKYKALVLYTLNITVLYWSGLWLWHCRANCCMTLNCHVFKSLVTEFVYLNSESCCSLFNISHGCLLTLEKRKQFWSNTFYHRHLLCVTFLYWENRDEISLFKSDLHHSFENGWICRLTFKTSEECSIPSSNLKRHINVPRCTVRYKCVNVKDPILNYLHPIFYPILYLLLLYLSLIHPSCTSAAYPWIFNASFSVSFILQFSSSICPSSYIKASFTAFHCTLCHICQCISSDLHCQPWRSVSVLVWVKSGTIPPMFICTHSHTAWTYCSLLNTQIPRESR